MSERYFQSDIRASGQIYEYNAPLRQIYALSGSAGVSSSGNWEISGTSAALAATLPSLYQASGLYELSGTSYTKAESNARFEASGSVLAFSGTLPSAYQASGLYQISGTSYTKAESTARFEVSGTSAALAATLPGLYAVSGYHYLAGSGLTSTLESYHVGIGSGLYLQNDLVGYDIVAETARNAALYVPLTRTIAAGSGLIGGGDLSANRVIDIAIGSGLYLQDNLVGFDVAAELTRLNPLYQASGLYQLSGTSYTKSESDSRYAASGTIGAGTGTVVGTGTSGTVPVFNSASGLTNSRIFQSGTSIVISGLLKLASTTDGYGVVIDPYTGAGADVTFTLPPYDGVLLTTLDLPDYGLLNSDPILEYSPVSIVPTDGPQGFRCWPNTVAGGYFQITSTGGSNPVVSFGQNNGTTTRWEFRNDYYTENVLSVIGKFFATIVSGASGVLGVTSVRGQDTDTRYALSGQLAATYQLSGQMGTGLGVANTVPKWTGANTQGVSKIYDDGTTVAMSGNLSLSNGVIQSTVSGTASIPVFHLVDPVARGGIVRTFQISGLSDGIGVVLNNLGEFGVGYNAQTQTGVILGFIAQTSAHPSWASTVLNRGLLSYINHNDTAITPAAIYGTDALGFISAGATVPSNAFAVMGSYALAGSASDSSSYSGKKLAAQRLNFTATGAGYNSSVIDASAHIDSVFGNWDLVTELFCDFRGYLFNKGNQANPTNRPVTASSARVPIQAMASGTQAGILGVNRITDLSTATGHVGEHVNQCKDSFFMSIPYPAIQSSGSATTRAVNTAHLAFKAHPAAAGGPTWATWYNPEDSVQYVGSSGYYGVYFDDGTSNTKGLYQHDGSTWNRLLSSKDAGVTQNIVVSISGGGFSTLHFVSGILTSVT